MSEPRFYPPISGATFSQLRIIRRLATEDAGYLTDDACPYHGDDLYLLQALVTSSPSPESSGGDSGVGIAAGEPVNVLQETEALYRDLKTSGATMKTGDPADRNTYFRLATTLMERLVQAREKAAGVANVEAFTNAVLDALEDELTVDQRDRILSKLKGILAA
jgi:hypothetical protein